jgi:hypothetical protein
MADDFGRILDLAEDVLVEHGFSVVMVSGNAILAAHVLDDDRDPGFGHQRALEISEALHLAIGRRAGADLRVRVATCLHVDDAVVRAVTPLEIVGGGIVRMASWAPPATASGLFATPSALAGVVGFDATTEPGQLALRIRSRD